jgi:hypothetical protein
MTGESPGAGPAGSGPPPRKAWDMFEKRAIRERAAGSEAVW